MKFKIYIILFLVIITFCCYSQNTALIYGKITDSKKKPIELATIAIMGYIQKSLSDNHGYYQLSIPANTDINIFISFVGYKTDTIFLNLNSGEKKELNCILFPSTTVLPDLKVTENKSIINNIQKIDPRTANVIPTVSGSIESIIKTLPGVSSNNELSSQYSVRGGNFDENLVYVNDIEVYRPFLVRSGQQEGLSFINSDLVSGIQFSAGGFDAKYGDKMSSVLDIQYKKPKEFAGSVAGSLLGYAGHLEGVSKNTLFSYLIGFRQKSNKYLLNSLDTKGDYKPSFTDVQSEFNYMVNEKFNIDFLGNYARNIYKLIPQTRQTRFGTMNDALQLTVYFDGQEVDRFDTYFGAFSGNYNPQNNLNLKFITSAYRTNESETFDIQGQYSLDQLETNFGKDEFGSVAFNMGVGTFLNHARNYLNASVINAEHKGTYILDNLIHYWGIRFQKEYIYDRLSEWQMLDSAGYSLPHSPDSAGYSNPLIQPSYALEMQNVVKTTNTLSSNRYSGYYQQKWLFENDSSTFSLTIGSRASFWDLNKQLLISPRATFSFKPNWKRDFIFRFSSGYYHQPPFYRELRDLDGNINKNLKAQTSVHFLLSGQYDFIAWGRPFKYVTEAYYKILDNIIPYVIDNVRIRYYAKNMAHGYATGIDMKVNGEFVKGIESWASLSIMKTMEDIEGDYYNDFYNKYGELITYETNDQVAADSIRHDIGYIPRPTDQLVNFALFFQDYLPKNPTYKMHLSLFFGSGLPVSPPTYKKLKNTLRMPSYRRVDIGFSKQVKSENTSFKPKNPLNNFKSIWLSLEVFNLLQVNNVISYIWIKDVTNSMLGVPNYLTPRQLNLRLVADF